MAKKKEALGKGIRALLQDIDSSESVQQAAPQPVPVLQVGVSEIPLNEPDNKHCKANDIIFFRDN